MVSNKVILIMIVIAIILLGASLWINIAASKEFVISKPESIGNNEGNINLVIEPYQEAKGGNE